MNEILFNRELALQQTSVCFDTEQIFAVIGIKRLRKTICQTVANANQNQTLCNVPPKQNVAIKKTVPIGAVFLLWEILTNAKVFLATKFVGAVLSLENINHANTNKTRLLALRYGLYSIQDLTHSTNSTSIVNQLTPASALSYKHIIPMFQYRKIL